MALSASRVTPISVFNVKSSKEKPRVIRRQSVKPERKQQNKVMNANEVKKGRWKLDMSKVVTFALFYHKDRKKYNVMNQLRNDIIKKPIGWTAAELYDRLKCLPKKTLRLLTLPKMAGVQIEDIPNVYDYGDTTPQKWCQMIIKKSTNERVKELDYNTLMKLKSDDKRFGGEELGTWDDVGCLLGALPGAKGILLKRGVNSS